MDRREARDQYVERLMERVREDEYPSIDQLDRLEALLPPERVGDYVAILLEKVERSRFPSIPMLDRIERLAFRSGP
jgi:hypothetical protein